MELAQQVRHASTKSDIRSRDLSIIVGYLAFALLLLVAIYLAAGQTGTAPIDVVDMTAFP